MSATTFLWLSIKLDGADGAARKCAYAWECEGIALSWRRLKLVSYAWICLNAQKVLEGFAVIRLERDYGRKNFQRTHTHTHTRNYMCLALMGWLLSDAHAMPRAVMNDVSNFWTAAKAAATQATAAVAVVLNLLAGSLSIWTHMSSRRKCPKQQRKAFKWATAQKD